MVLSGFTLQRFDLPCEVLMGGDKLPKVNEGADQLDAGSDRHRTFEDVGEHHGAMLRKHGGRILDVLSHLQGHNL